MPPNTIRVCRPTRWGNPFRVGRDGDAQTCVDRYRADLDSRIAADPALLTELRSALRGRDLACWCAPGAPCHADVLLERANAT